MEKKQPPTYQDLLWPTLKALEKLGGSASIQELVDQVVADLKLSDEIMGIPHKDGPKSLVSYRADWARTHLKYVGAADNTSRGIWTITEKGRGIQTEAQIRDSVRQYLNDRNKTKKPRNVAFEFESYGAPAIDLIDGDALCDHLRKLELGVKIETKEIVKPVPEFFQRL